MMFPFFQVGETRGDPSFPFNQAKSAMRGFTGGKEGLRPIPIEYAAIAEAYGDVS
jgi:hypothetical protein